MNLYPYLKEYKTEQEVKADFEAGAKFICNSEPARLVTIHDVRSARIRYGNLKTFVMVRGRK